MPEITVTVDGKARTTEALVVRELIKDKRVIAARVDGVLVDLATGLKDGQVMETVLAESKEGVGILRHSTAHVMAEAVKLLFPDARPTIGPSTEEGSIMTSTVARHFLQKTLPRSKRKWQSSSNRTLLLSAGNCLKRTRGLSLKKRESPIRWRSSMIWAMT